MVKLRTKSTQQPIYSPDTDAPSTSKSLQSISTRRRISSTPSTDQHSSVISPDSPSPSVGRIAKSNAKILNGLDLSHAKRVYADDMFGILPDLKTLELGEKCPTIYKMLKNSERTLELETLHLIQHELEEFISENVDYQKTIHGEITYLTTGEYPTIDLSNRQIPSFETLRKQEHNKLKERAKQIDSASNMNLADLGILSSPEEEDVPHILDVPQRFWTWAKEYLRHISLDYMRDFKEKLVDRFSNHQLEKYCQEVDLSLSNSQKSVSSQNTKHLSQQNKRKLTTEEEDISHKTPRKMARIELSHSVNSDHIATNGFNKRNAKETIACKKESLTVIAKQQNGTIINSDGRRQSFGKGIKIRFPLEPPKCNKELKKEEKAAARGINGDRLADSSSGDDEGHEEATNAAKDAVSQELRKKQNQLRELANRTRPFIEEFYSRVLKELALYEVFRHLDEVDNKLYALGSKYERLSFFNKDQRQEAHTALIEHTRIYTKYRSIADCSCKEGEG